MSLKRAQLAAIDNETKFTVTGYIRNQHKSLFKSSQYVLFQNIPIAISSLCTLYYHLCDYFELIPDSTSISNNKRCIKQQVVHHRHTNFGFMKIASKGKSICEWHLNYTEGDHGSSYRQIVWIGISSKPFNPNAYCHSQPGDLDHKHFAYGYGNRQAYNYYGGCWNYLDSLAFEPGDKLCLVLNLKKRILKLLINERDCGHTFGVKTGDDIDYRLAVIIFRRGSTVTLTKFTQTY